MAPDGTRLRRLAPVRTTADAAVFSPDGRLMAYNDRRGTMVRPVAGGRARRLLTGLWVKAWAPRPADSVDISVVGTKMLLVRATSSR